MTCRTMVEPDDAGACPRCGTTPPHLVSVPPPSRSASMAPRSLSGAPPPGLRSMRPDVAVRDPGLGERLGEIVSERPLLVVATVAVVLVGTLGAYLVLRPARADGTADAKPTGSAIPERVASPALASPFRVHTSQHAGLRVRLPQDFDSDPDPTSMQHGNDGRKVWLAFFRRGNPRGPLAYAAHVAPGAEDTGAGRDDGGEKLVAFVRAASQSFLSGMGARTDVQTASMDQCAMVVGPAARIASCSGVYRSTTGNGPLGLSCQRRGATYYCFGWVGDPGIGPGELDAIAATLEPLLPARSTSLAPFSSRPARTSPSGWATCAAPSSKTWRRQGQRQLVTGDTIDLSEG